MADTYTVQKGDTRSQIAKKLGVTLDQVGMGKSGNADLIYEGESLNIGSPEKSEASSYASEVSSQLGNMGDTSKKSVSQSAYGGESTTEDPYGISSIKKELETYKTKMDDAYNTLKTIKSDTYDSEYSSRGMDEKKTKISSLDTEISSAKAARDEAISKLKQNPGLSAAQMTGQSKKIADYQNNIINNLVDERNNLATEYNTDLSEIDKIVTNKSGEAETSYNYYAGLLGNANTKLGNYQSALTSELKDTQTQSNWEKELEQAMNIATMNANKASSATNLKLVTDPYTGAPKYWYNSSTGEIIQLGDETSDEGSTGSTLFNKTKTTAPETNTQNSGWWQSLVNGVKSFFGGG